jgi:CHAT domain-containing protein
MRSAQEHLQMEEFHWHANLPSPDVEGGQKGDGERIRQHLAECPECSRFASFCQALMRMKKSENSGGIGGAECIPAATLYRLAAGQVEPDDAARLMRHASECAICAGTLRQAIADLGGEDEGAPVATPEYKSSTPEWQGALAAKMATIAHPVHGRLVAMPRRQSQIWWAACAAAVLLCCVAGALWYVRQESVDQLLVAAYNEHRPTELRIPGGSDVSVYSPTRESGGQSQGTDLLKAKLRVEEGSQAHPQSARWNDAMGQVALLEQNWQSAFTYLQLAQLQSESPSRVEFDLGVAYFERAEALQAPEDYARAIESFTAFMKRNGRTDAVTLYNRGICFERIGLLADALSDFSAAEKLEPDARWRKEIRSKVEALEHGQPKSMSGPSLNYDGYEYRLESALEAPDGAEQKEWEGLARLGERHSDLWVADWLREKGHNESASELLRSGARASRAGNPAAAFVEEQEAASQFGNDRAVAGRARALTEVALAAQRMGKSKECLDAISAVRHMPYLMRSSLLQVFALTEESICKSMQGSLDEGREVAARASELAESNQLPEARIRAQGMLASFATSQGLVEQAWRLNVGILNVGGESLPANRRYQSLSDMTFDARAMDVPEVAAILARDAVEAAQKTQNKQNIAYSEEILGERLTAVGQIAAAEESFRAADASLREFGSNDAVQVFHADWAVNRADLTAARSGAQAALTELRTYAEPAGANQDLFIAMRYWIQRTQIELDAGDAAAAESSGRHALSFAVRGLSRLHGVGGREAWQNRVRPAYQAMVLAMLQNDKAEQALKTWLDFQGASDDQLQKSRASEKASEKETVTLVYVRLRDRYVVFTQRAGDQAPSVRFLSGSASRIDQMARSFTLLCSDRRSSKADILRVSGELYKLLVEPVDVHGQSLLRVDATGSLASVPFAALQRADGRYVGDEVEVVQVPKFWKKVGSERPMIFSDLASVEIARSPSAPDDPSSRIPGVYDETPDILRQFPRAHATLTNEMTPELLLRRMANVDIFHFEGHTAHGIGGFGLILNPDDRKLFTSRSLVGARVGARLVVLAACESAGEQSDESQSNFSESFLRAGARGVLASAWPVDSKATHVLVVLFYQELAKGMEPATALKNAQVVIRHSPIGFEHPYYWAGFSLMTV